MGKRLLEQPVRGWPKGHKIDPDTVGEIKALLGEQPPRRDLLIEYLHKIQDRYGYICST